MNPLPTFSEAAFLAGMRSPQEEILSQAELKRRVKDIFSTIIPKLFHQIDAMRDSYVREIQGHLNLPVERSLHPRVLLGFLNASKRVAAQEFPYEMCKERFLKTNPFKPEYTWIQSVHKADRISLVVQHELLDNLQESIIEEREQIRKFHWLKHCNDVIAVNAIQDIWKILEDGVKRTLSATSHYLDKAEVAYQSFDQRKVDGRVLSLVTYVQRWCERVEKLLAHVITLPSNTAEEKERLTKCIESVKVPAAMQEILAGTELTPDVYERLVADFKKISRAEAAFQLLSVAFQVDGFVCWELMKSLEIEFLQLQKFRGSDCCEFNTLLERADGGHNARKRSKPQTSPATVTKKPR